MNWYQHCPFKYAHFCNKTNTEIFIQKIQMPYNIYLYIERGFKSFNKKTENDKYELICLKKKIKQVLKTCSCPTQNGLVQWSSSSPASIEGQTTFEGRGCS